MISIFKLQSIKTILFSEQSYKNVYYNEPYSSEKNYIMYMHRKKFKIYPQNNKNYL